MGRCVVGRVVFDVSNYFSASIFRDSHRL